MLKPADAVIGLAELRGTTPLSTKHALRLVREAKLGLWPEIGSGNRGDVRLRHLLNGWVALACAPGQPSDGPRRAYEFGLLRPVLVRRRDPVGLPPGANPLLFPDEYRETSESWASTGMSKTPLVTILQGLVIEAVDNAMGRLAVQNDGQLPDFQQIRINLSFHGLPMTAELVWTFPNDPHVSEIDIYVVEQDTLPGLSLIDAPRNRIDRLQVIIGRDEIQAFARLAAKTSDFDLPQNSTPALNASGENDAVIPETKKAAGAPPPNGLQSGQSASRASALAKTTHLHNAQSTAQEGGKQSPSDTGGRELKVRRHATATTPPTTRRTRRYVEPLWTNAASP